jgi:hypothetical protein
LLSIGYGSHRHAARRLEPNSPATFTEFGSGHDEEHAQAMAMALVRARPKRNHPHEVFAVATEASSNTPTLYYDKARGHLLGRGHPYTENLNYEVKLVLELRAHHRLRVASYKERAIDVPPTREDP